MLIRHLRVRKSKWEPSSSTTMPKENSQEASRQGVLKIDPIIFEVLLFFQLFLTHTVAQLSKTVLRAATLD